MKDRKREKGPGIIGILVGFLLAVILLAALCLFLAFGWNHFSVSVVLRGQELVTVEYGSTYEDPGYEIRLTGTKLLAEGVALDVPASVNGAVDVSRLGRYPLEYSVDIYGMKDSAQRMVTVVDTEDPELFLFPDPENMPIEAEYREAGFSAYDNYDGDITDRVQRQVEDDRVIYTVADSSGNSVSAERIVHTLDTQPPVITLAGGEAVQVYLGTEYQDPGFSAVDLRDGDLTEAVEVVLETEAFSRFLPGEYRVHYTVSDSSGNTAYAERTVTTVPYPHPQTIYPKGKTIYLTFDDGPFPDTNRLLDMLAQYGVKVTFFVVDTGYPDIMRRIVQEGHSIGIHTKSHVYKTIYESPEAYFADLFAMQKIVLDATGVETWLLRFPGGSSNTISYKSKGIMTFLTKAVEDAGFSYFDWNVDSDDAGKARNPNAVFQNVIKGVSENPISIVLQHDIHSYSVDAVERIIQWGLENGYQFLPLQTDSPDMHHEVLN